MRGEDAAHEEQEFLEAEDVDAGPLGAEDGPEAAQPGVGAGRADEREEVGEVGGEGLLGERAVGHPEGVEEAFPELGGFEDGEGLEGFEVCLERLEGCDAEFAI